MPAFARRSGGPLTDDQVDAIVGGIRRRWGSQADDSAARDASAARDLPPYADSASAAAAADAHRGAAVFETYCRQCHGAGGRGGSRASSIVDPAYLALVSDQGLRTTVIAGRPELGAPDWRGNLPGRPMTSQEITDVVAWLSAQRPRFADSLSSSRP
jgi:mono/diheme cytochrome c family protein